MVFIKEMFGKSFLFVIMFFWCTSFASAKEIRLPEYLKYSGEATRTFSKEIEKELGIYCCGSGGSMPDDVEEIEVECFAYQHATIEQARDLLIKATEKLRSTINSHLKLRPFLREYPFTVPRTKVAISFVKKRTNESYTDGSVAYVFQVRNRIYYHAEDAKTHNFIDLFDEPYEEALKKGQTAHSTK